MAEGTPIVIDSTLVHYTLASQPTLTIGNDPQGSLFQVLGVLKLSDGNLVIANGQDRESVVVDTAGKVLRRVGRKGSGPGEFELLGRPLRAPHDEIVTLDLRLRRLTWLADTGIIRTAPLDPPTAVPQPSAIGVRSDGSVLVTNGAFALSASGEPRVERDTLPVVRYLPDGRLGDRVGVVPGVEFEVRDNASNPGGPLRRSPREFGVASGLAVVGDRLVVADNGTGNIALYDGDGNRLRIPRFGDGPRSVTAADVKLLRAQRLDAISDSSRRNRIATVLAEQAHPRTVAPAFDSRLFVDAGGKLWIGSYRMPTDTTQLWRQVSLDGRLLGAVDVPASFMPTDVNGRYMIGIWQDSDGVQTVREYELHPIASSSPPGSPRNDSRRRLRAPSDFSLQPSAFSFQLSAPRPTPHALRPTTPPTTSPSPPAHS
jgi:hypothetical protein